MVMYSVFRLTSHRTWSNFASKIIRKILIVEPVIQYCNSYVAT